MKREDAESMFGAPVPGKAVVFIPAEPMPVHIMPEFCGDLSQFDFVRLFSVEIGTGNEQALNQKGRFHEVGTVVFLAEGEGLAGAAIEPMREGAMQVLSIGLVTQEGGYFEDARGGVFTAHPASFRRDNNGGNAEARTADSGLPGRLVATVFIRKAGFLVGMLPHIAERITLKLVEKGAIFGQGILDSGRRITADGSGFRGRGSFGTGFGGLFLRHGCFLRCDRLCRLHAMSRGDVLFRGIFRRRNSVNAEESEYRYRNERDDSFQGTVRPSMLNDNGATIGRNSEKRKKKDRS